MDTYEYSDIDDEFSYTKKDESITIICKLHLKFNDVSFNIISKELDLDIDAIRDIINLSINKCIKFGYRYIYSLIDNNKILLDFYKNEGFTIITVNNEYLVKKCIS